MTTQPLLSVPSAPPAKPLGSAQPTEVGFDKVLADATGDLTEGQNNPTQTSSQTPHTSAERSAVSVKTTGRILAGQTLAPLAANDSAAPVPVDTAEAAASASADGDVQTQAKPDTSQTNLADEDKAAIVNADGVPTIAIATIPPPVPPPVPVLKTASTDIAATTKPDGAAVAGSSLSPQNPNQALLKAQAAATTDTPPPPSGAPELARSGKETAFAALIARQTKTQDTTASEKTGSALSSAPEAATAEASTPPALPPTDPTAPKTQAAIATAAIQALPEASAAAPAPVTSPSGQTVPNAQPAPTPAAPVLQASLSSLSPATIETTAHLAAQITRRLEGRSTRFEMALTPEGLGRVDVSLDIDADGQLAARLAFDNPLAATELRGRADELRRQLQDAGFTLGQDALNFAERDPTQSGGGFDRQQDRSAAYASRRDARARLDADFATPAPTAWISLSLTPQGVDMKV